MWPNFDGKPYTREQLAAHVAHQDFSHWRNKGGTLDHPKFITLHNTSVPSLELWLSWSPAHRQEYIRNMQPYYAGMGWHAGPHFFVPPTADIVAFGFSDLGTCGTHASCFNSDSIGIEMVGEYAREVFDTGPGSIVRDNAVYLMALLHNRLNLNPANIRFHVECKADNHDCPGQHVSKTDIIARVKKATGELAGQPTPPPNVPVPPVPTPPPIEAPPPAPSADRPVLFKVAGKMSTFGGPKDTGVGPEDGLGVFPVGEESMKAHGLGDWLLTPAQADAPGLARRLDPSRFYLACRWDVRTYQQLRASVAHVTANGRTIEARPVDWGPDTKTGRVADLSPGLAKALGLVTDQICEVVVYKDGK